MLEAVLPHLARALKSQPINSMILNLIIHNSLRHIELFSQTSYCILLFDQFLFVWKEYEHVLHHTLRLLWSVHEKIDRQELVRLLTATQPSSQASIIMFRCFVAVLSGTPRSFEKSLFSWFI